MANSDHKGDGAPPSKIHVGPATKKAGWLPWLLLGLGLLALLFGLRRCSNDEATTRVETAPAAAPVADTAMVPAPAPTAPAGTTAILAGTSGVGSYLAGTDVLPRTFVFEKLYFDTAKSDIRAADREEVSMLSAAMKQYPNSRIQIVGYADARGDASANATLGKERAESVKAALVADGTAADRIDTASGGETNPADTNATSSGQAENRRTELIVLQR
jgi:outer membrane protein OmpA-like peptidoglycan-associated protein